MHGLRSQRRVRAGMPHDSADPARGEVATAWGCPAMRYQLALIVAAVPGGPQNCDRCLGGRFRTTPTVEFDT
jgi:hypothetical protein